MIQYDTLCQDVTAVNKVLNLQPGCYLLFLFMSINYVWHSFKKKNKMYASGFLVC